MILCGAAAFTHNDKHLLIAGEAICSRILASPALQQHSTFGCYVHAERLREVDTTAVLNSLLARGAEFAVNVGIVAVFAHAMCMICTFSSSVAPCRTGHAVLCAACGGQ